MLGSAAIAQVQQFLGMRSDLAARLETTFAVAQTKFEQGVPTQNGGNYMPWFLVKESVGLVTTANIRTVPLPSDFLLENEGDKLFWYQPTSTDQPYTELLKDDADILRKNFPGTGGPKGYTLSGLNFIMSPTPDAVYQLQTSYFAADAPFTTAGENLWMKYAPNILIGEAGIAATIFTREAKPDIMQYFQGIRQEAIQALFIQTEARLHTNRVYAMGGDD